MKKIIEFFARETMLVNFIVVLVTCVGLYSMFTVQREIMPQTESGRMYISVAYPGASPEDVELNTIVPIEDILREINGIDEFTSVSMQSRGTVLITLDEDIDDLEAVKNDIYRKISRNTIRDLPDEVETVTVSEMNPRLIPVYRFSLSIKDGVDVPEYELYQTAKMLDDLLTRKKGISQVDRSGYREREIQIEVDPRKMQHEYIALDEIVSAISSRNVRRTGGTVRSASREETVLAIGQFENPADVQQVIVRSGFDRPDIRVQDIAVVKDSFEEETSRVLVNGRKGVVFTVRKRENTDIIDAVATVKRFLEDNRNLYDSRFDVELVEDNSASVRSLIDVVVNNAVIGFVIVFIILLLFLDLKTSFWTAFGIPVCLFIMLIYMRVTNLSLNMISLGAFITVLGMLVDDAIVIGENIYEKRRLGLSAFDAAVAGVTEVGAPVLVTILTTVAAFLPLLAIKGMMGKFISVYPVIITVTLLASLVEAFLLLPNHLAHGRQPARQRENQWFAKLKGRYGVWLAGMLKWRYPVMICFVLLLAGSVFISSSTVRRFVLFWDNSADDITIDLEGPTGITLDVMQRISGDVELRSAKLFPRR
jgi:multidrug efflux pump subunit AcrB